MGIKSPWQIAQIMAIVMTSLVTINSWAEIYKSVTPEGRVVYTDNADNAYQASQDASRIEVLDKLTSISSNVAATGTPSTTAVAANRLAITSDNAVTTPPPNATLSTTKVKPSQTGDYQLTILSPTPDMAYRRVTQPVEVTVKLIPVLRTGDRVIYRVNGNHIATTQAMQFSIPTDEFNPGHYQLTVDVENILGDVIASKNQNFYILSNNMATQRKQKTAAAAKAAYDKLPWYKKIKLNVSL